MPNTSIHSHPPFKKSVLCVMPPKVRLIILISYSVPVYGILAHESLIVFVFLRCFQPFDGSSVRL